MVAVGLASESQPACVNTTFSPELALVTCGRGFEFSNYVGSVRPMVAEGFGSDSQPVCVKTQASCLRRPWLPVGV